MRALAAGGGLSALGAVLVAGGVWGVAVLGVLAMSALLLVAGVVFARSERPARRLNALLRTVRPPRLDQGDTRATRP